MEHKSSLHVSLPPTFSRCAPHAWRPYSCHHIAQLLAILRYDEERAVALAHLIMVRSHAASACITSFSAGAWVTRWCSAAAMGTTALSY